jgi:pimeloyl-ACP methyl ester carboxylesterase
MARAVIAMTLAAVFAVVADSPASGQAELTAGELRLEPCTDEEIQPPAKCGTFTVWENRDVRSGRTIDLNVVILEASGENPVDDPLVFLMGGPGQDATGSARGMSRQPLRMGRDILLVDQRGTGKSNGLYCGPDMTAPLQAFMPTMDAEAVRACRAELEKRADLRLYLTPYAMDDLDDLRDALGYEKINLSGGSYGTRAALVYIRRHGEHVRTALLSGATALSDPMPDRFAEYAEAALEAVLEDCAEDPACAEAFPALADDYREAVRVMEEDGPREIQVSDPRSDELVTVTLRAADFAESLRAMLYSPEPARRIPLFLHHAATTGDYRPFAEFQLRRNAGLRQGIAAGMYFAVSCTEDVARVHPDAVYEAARGTFLSDHRARPHIEGCEGWPLGRLPDGFGEEVESDVPVLLVTGENDPVTPPSSAQTAASRLGNARVVIVPFGGHGLGGLVAGPGCAARMYTTFLATADPDAVDTSCTEDVKRRPFVLSMDEAG